MGSRISTPHSRPPLTYDAVGVNSASEEHALQQLGTWINRTFSFNRAKPLLPLGYFANVLKLSADMGLAISTDGVGTKLLVAQAMRRYDTVGIDCIAMNVNDVLCVGATPVSMVDYIAVSTMDAGVLGEIAKGLHDGAQLAAITIPGGEIAQIRELLHHTSGQDFSFDLVGTCVGTVHPERLVIGQQINPGDLVIGFASSGIHSNGFTLARRALGLDENPSKYLQGMDGLDHTIGEELLTPTSIYVPEVKAILDAEVAVKALIHITSDGLLNLLRVASETGYVIDNPLPPQPIFSLIQQHGNVDIAEMFRVFNMGMGFCAVCAANDAPRVEQIAKQYGRRAGIIGYAVHDPQRRVWIPSHGLVGANGVFSSTYEKPPPYPDS
ncbi:MAG TPA: phosphoribosylformylglycinamidine cyclo-ligase [Candidatus Binataceae bacterium]|nr:phosphoribosylformylglycinamidine cyclo-ligase [Candidatus Binataceae bacterium]